MSMLTFADRVLNRETLPYWHALFLVLAITGSALLLVGLSTDALYSGSTESPLSLAWLAWVVASVAFLLFYFRAHLSQEDRRGARRLVVVIVTYPPLVLASYALFLFLFGFFGLVHIAHLGFILLLTLQTWRAFAQTRSTAC